MSKRKFQFEVGQYYHIYNRGTDKRKIFLNKGDLYYFFDSIQIANSEFTNKSRSGSRPDTRKKIKEKSVKAEKLVKIIAYSLLPNHYHFILKEIEEGGISRFMQKLGTSYTMYFNKKYDRTGVLFQGKFKESLLAYDHSLTKTSAYINLNYKHHKINPDKNLIKTSLFEYLGTEKGEMICDKKEIKNIINNAGGLEKYKKTLKYYSKIFTEEHNNNPDLIDFQELEN